MWGDWPGSGDNEEDTAEIDLTEPEPEPEVYDPSNLDPSETLTMSDGSPVLSMKEHLAEECRRQNI